jgi:Mn-dependent DtxR family transcriptional regulator
VQEAVKLQVEAVEKESCRCSHRIGELGVRRIVESGGRHETGPGGRRGRDNEQLRWRAAKTKEELR